MECVKIEEIVTPREARITLEPYFDELKQLFVDAGFDRIKQTTLRCSLDIHDTPRHFAGCLQDGTKIYASPQMIELPEDVVLGILAHELGHAVDFLYPAEFTIRDNTISRFPFDRNRLKGWKKRSEDTVEKTADLIAEAILGVPIGYRGPCHLQSLGYLGSRRPVGLR